MNNLFLLEYDIESLAKAIYCITSWFPNRRFLGIVNAVLVDTFDEIERYNGYLDGIERMLDMVHHRVVA